MTELETRQPCASLARAADLFGASRRAEAELEAVLQRLRLQDPERRPRSIALTGIAPGSGTSTVAAGLGWLLATQYRVPVLLVEAGAPWTGEGVAGEAPGDTVGLCQLLSGDAAAGDVLVATQFDRLRRIPRGVGEPAFAQTDLPALLAELEQAHGVVLIDTAAVLVEPQSAALGAAAGRTLLVARHGSARRAELRRAAALVQDSGGTLCGVVLNRVDDSLPGWLARAL